MVNGAKDTGFSRAHPLRSGAHEHASPAPDLSEDERRENRHAIDRSLVQGIAWTGGVKWLVQILTWASTLVVARLVTN